MTKWQLQDAKARFSELIDDTLEKGPQIVTRRGIDTAVVVSVEEEGQWRSGEVGLKAVFTTDTLTFQRDKQDPMQMKYKLDSTQKPKAIDTTHEIDLGKLILQLGVYSLDGDTLKLRLESAGKPRPDKLETKAKDTSVLFVAKRAKNKAGR